MKSSERVAERSRLMAQPDWLQVKTIEPLTFTMHQHDRVVVLMQLQLAMNDRINRGIFPCLASGFQARMYERLLGNPPHFYLEPKRLAPFALSAMEALMFLAQLQLALTHPVNRRPSIVVEVARGFGREIQERLSVNATIARVCELGWEVEDEAAT